MIVEFSVKNFRSIKELQTISFRATDIISDMTKYPELDTNNIVEEGGIRLLKTVGIYGANASGKSNVIRALECFCEAIKKLPSPESQLDDLAVPFLFQEKATSTTPFFQMVFLVEKTKYRYGFTVMNALDWPATNSKHTISNEWLFVEKKGTWEKIFIRTGKEIDKEGLLDKDKIPDLSYAHSLFLTHAASFTKGVCNVIWDFFSRNIVSNYASGGLAKYRFITLDLLKEEENKKRLLQFLANFQLSYEDIFIINEDRYSGKITPRDKVLLTKSFSNGQAHKIHLNLEQSESEGTKKLFDMAGLLLRAFNPSKFKGGLIVLDELDSNFHPSLLIKLIEFFNDPTINSGKIQLLFTSHDTNIMNPIFMRRDQFYFTEKDENEATKLYSLADLKGISNDADFAKQYLAGFYGGIPLLSNYL